jgi:1A family penicillin-binding protein
MARWQQNLRGRRYMGRTRFNTQKLLQSRKFVRIAKLVFVGSVVLIFGLIILLPIFALTLPTPDKVVRREGFSTKILDRNGKVIYDIYEDERRTPVKIDKIPLHLRQATISIEDKNFYQHEGYDTLGMIRGVSRLLTRGRAQGGSTLTQQLVKNVLLTSDRTLPRKVKEFVLAVQIERKYSKDEILQMYLNEAPYGGNIRGVQTAAQVYFGKDVSEINTVEAAILAGIPQRPSLYSPYSEASESYKDRTKEVLRRMREDGYITPEDEDSMISSLDTVEFQKKGGSFQAPHFVQFVEKILAERYGENAIETGGLKVTTTLDLDLQNAAQEIVSEEIASVADKYHITNGAAVVIDPATSEILAMVGSKDFNDPNYDGQVNVTTSLRQPGSAIKPITYATAFKKGFTPSTLIMDVATEFRAGAGQPMYTPENYDGKYRGPIQVRYALGNSINIPAVKMLGMVGIPEMLKTAYDLGITSLEPTKETLSRVGLSVTLGGGEVRLIDLTSAYGAFANGGFRVEPISILKVEDLEGKVLEETKIKNGKRVLSEGEAFLIADILSDNSARTDVFGPNSLLNIPGRKVAVKTGTTNDKRDNWALGGTPQVVVGVWVGNNDNSPMLRVASGVSGASPIWRKILLKALEGRPKEDFEKPGEVEQGQVDLLSGYKAHDGFAERTEYYIKGRDPGEDTVHVMLKLCKNDGNLANPADVASKNYFEKEFIVFKEEDPTATGGAENLWQRAVLNWVNGQSDSRYHPPTDYCGATNPLSVRFREPSNEASNLPETFNIKISADSFDEIQQVEVFADGEKVKTFTSHPFETELSLNEGVHTLTAKARDAQNRESETSIKIGVGVEWNSQDPSPEPVD